MNGVGGSRVETAFIESDIGPRFAGKRGERQPKKEEKK